MRRTDTDESPETGVTHLFANSNGTADISINAFTPNGYSSTEAAVYEDKSGSEFKNFRRFFYAPGSLSNYGYSGGLIINFTHIGPTDIKGNPNSPNRNVKNVMGSIAVGTIGGSGGNQEFIGGSSDGFYVHSHMVFNSWDGKKKSRPNFGTRIDPRKVFCGDFYAN